MSRKITEADVMQAWHDAMAGDQPVVEQGGMTVRELMQECGLTHTAARKRIARLLKQGRVRKIGVRPDRNRPPVYELVGPKSKGRTRA